MVSAFHRRILALVSRKVAFEFHRNACMDVCSRHNPSDRMRASCDSTRTVDLLRKVSQILRSGWDLLSRHTKKAYQLLLLVKPGTIKQLYPRKKLGLLALSKRFHQCLSHKHRYIGTRATIAHQKYCKQISRDINLNRMALYSYPSVLPAIIVKFSSVKPFGVSPK